MGAVGFGRAPAATSPHGSPGVMMSRHGAICWPVLSIYHLGYPMAGSGAPTADKPVPCWADAHPAVTTTHAITASRIPAVFVLSILFIFSSLLIDHFHRLPRNRPTPFAAFAISHDEFSGGRFTPIARC